MSNDRRIGLQLPAYGDKRFITPEDAAYWEVLYTDGTVQRETDLKPYDSIDRGRLQSFRVIHHGEILMECWPDATRGSTGHNLVWRRRTTLSPGVGRAVILLFGFAPMGPIWALSVEQETYYQSDVGFIEGHEVLSPPTPQPGEPKEMVQKKET